MDFSTGITLLLLLLFSLRVCGLKELANSEINLSVNFRPSYAFTLSSVTKNVHLGLWRNSSKGAVFPFKINVVVESMNCSLNQEVNLVIQNGNENFSLCHTVQNELRNFETVSVKEVFDGQTQVHIMTSGNWTDIEANLVASVYYEVEGNCQNCDPGFFCCEDSNSQCNSKRYSTQDTASVSKVRCIPQSSLWGQRDSLLCDGHPNCGRLCNADESVVFCENKGKIADSMCSGNDCSFDGFLLTLIILGIFTLISVIYSLIIITMSPTVRKFLGISSFLPMMHRNPHEDVDDNNSSTDSNSVRSIFVYVNNVNISTISRPENDLPPNYDDLELGRRNKIEIKVQEINNEELDLPSFTEAVNFQYRDFNQITSSGNGILNPSYENYVYDSQNPKSDVDKY